MSTVERTTSPRRIDSLRPGPLRPGPLRSIGDRLSSVVLGRSRVSLVLVLGLAAVLGFWGLEREGLSNLYYAATVRSMLTSWHAFLFASFDPGGFVTVDKPPLGFWIQAASAFLFGFSGTSLLLPGVLAHVTSVGIVHRIVAPRFGPPAGLIAALVLALTPVSVATARNNTPDSILVLFLVLAAWATLIAAERGSLRWLVMGMVLVGLGFNVKMLQAYLALPGLLLVYLAAARASPLRRIAHLALAGLVLVAVSLSWAVAVDLVPADERPYVGGSETNSVIELALGYNGLGRLLGAFGGTAPAPVTDAPPAAASPGPGSPGPGSPGGRPTGVAAGPYVVAGGSGGENGEPGPLRLINPQLGGQAGWLLPMAIAAMVGLARPSMRRRRPTHPDAEDGAPNAALDGTRAVLLWGGWLGAGAAFFSVAGFMHPYYLVTIAPPIAVLIGAGAPALWRSYRRPGASGWLLPVAVAATGLVQASILGPYGEWSALVPVALAGALGGAAVLIVARLARMSRLRDGSVPVRRGARVVPVSAALASAALLIAPTIWGLIPVAETRGFMLPAAGPAARPAAGAFRTPGSGFPPAGSMQGPAGPDGMSAPDPKLVAYLLANRGTSRFLAATESWSSAAPIILATGEAVMALHGFGADQILSSDELARRVAGGEVRFFLIAGDEVSMGPTPGHMPGSPGTGGTVVLPPPRADDASGWVRERCREVPAEQWRSDGGAADGGRPGAAFGPPGAGLGEALYDCGDAAGDL